MKKVCIRENILTEGGQVTQENSTRTKAHIICSFDVTLYSWAMIIVISLQRVIEQITAIQTQPNAVYVGAAGAKRQAIEHTHTHKPQWLLGFLQ